MITFSPFKYKIRLVGCCTDSCKDYIVDCQDYLARGHTASGVYYVTPTRAFHGYNVYCDMITDGGGWLVKYLQFLILKPFLSLFCYTS